MVNLYFPAGYSSSRSRTAYTEQCAMYSLHFTLYTLYWTVYIVPCTLYSAHCRQYTVHNSVDYHANLKLERRDLAISQFGSCNICLVRYKENILKTTLLKGNCPAKLSPSVAPTGDHTSLVRGFRKVGLIGCQALETNQTSMQTNILVLQLKCHMQFKGFKTTQSVLYLTGLY